MTLSRRNFVQGAAAAAVVAATPRALADTSTGPSTSAAGSNQIAPEQCPVDTIVICMMENRSFDHYLGTMPGVDGLRREMSNPAATGRKVPVFELDRDVIANPDPNHSWLGGRRQLNGGKMDGFVVTTGSDEPMGYYTARTIPWLRAFAQTYTTADRWFCSHLGNTWPNRNYFHAAQDFGATSNDSSGHDGSKTIYAQLDSAGISWKYYFIDLPFLSSYPEFQTWVSQGKVGTVADYLAEALAGELPQVAIVDPGFFINDDHPPADIQLGQRFMADVHDALARGPHWRSSALFVTYDEWGGFYDHVVPPKMPDLRPSDDINKDHSQLGFRVPTVIAGPYAKRNFIDHTTMDHTSATKFIEWRFGLKAMTPRDAAAHNPAFTAFDFLNPNFEVPDLPTPKIDPIAVAVSVAGLVGLPNPVPELTAIALARTPRTMLQLPGDKNFAIPTFDRTTGKVTTL